MAVAGAKKRAPFYASSQVTGQTPQILEQAVSRALLHRWSAMLTHAAATAYAASLEGSDGASIVPVKPTSRALHPPSASFSLRPRQNTHQPAEFPPSHLTGFCHLGTDTVNLWTCGTPGDRPEEKLFSLTELLQQKGAEKNNSIKRIELQ